MSLKMVLGENSAKVNLPDGKSYELSPLTLGDIAEAEEKFGCDLESFNVAVKKLKNVLFLIFLSLRRKSPSIKLEMIGDMFGLGDMGELTKIIESIFNISGLSAPAGDKAEKNG